MNSVSLSGNQMNPASSTLSPCFAFHKFQRSTPTPYPSPASPMPPTNLPTIFDATTQITFQQLEQRIQQTFTSATDSDSSVQ